MQGDVIAVIVGSPVKYSTGDVVSVNTAANLEPINTLTRLPAFKTKLILNEVFIAIQIYKI